MPWPRGRPRDAATKSKQRAAIHARMAADPAYYEKSVATLAQHRGNRRGVPHTAETRARIAASQCGKTMSVETRHKMSINNAARRPAEKSRRRELWADDGWRARILAARDASPKEQTRRQRSAIASYGAATRFKRGAPSLNKGKPLPVTVRQKISIATKGRKLSARARQLQRDRMTKLWADPEYRAWHAAMMRTKHLNGEIEIPRRKWSRLPYLDARGRLWTFRSTWEVKLAQWLDARGLTWDYEPHRLLLSDGRVYVPDFWVAEWASYVEVKGWRGWNLDKVDTARADGHRVRVVGDITAGDAELVAAVTEEEHGA